MLVSKTGDDSNKSRIIGVIETITYSKGQQKEKRICKIREIDPVQYKHGTTKYKPYL